MNLRWVKSTFTYQYRYYVMLFTDVFISNKFSNNLSYCSLLPKPAEVKHFQPFRNGQLLYCCKLTCEGICTSRIKPPVFILAILKCAHIIR